MVEPVRYVSFQPVFHNWFNKRRGILCDGTYKIFHTANRRVTHEVEAAGFPSRYLSGPLPYFCRHKTVNKMC